MNELSAFERRLAASLEAVAGPQRSIDSIAIARTAASRAPVQSSIWWRLSAAIGPGTRGRGRRLGDLAEGRATHPLVVLIAVLLIAALAFGALAVGARLVRLPSVVPPSPSPNPSSAVTTPSPHASARSGSWTLVSKTESGQWKGTATLLSDGEVLAAGGGGSGASAAAERYDPVTGRWTETGSMHALRAYGHSATLLPNGKVLVAGGAQRGSPSTGQPAQSGAELYDAATGTWTETGSMAVARKDHSATPLPDGKVLVAGGKSDRGDSKTAELYDPATGTWTATGNMRLGRSAPTAVLLRDGRVLVVGGSDIADPEHQSAEIYNPGSGTWAPASSFAGAGACRIATSLLDGNILVVCAEASGARTSAEVYNQANDGWAPTGSPPKECCVGEAGPRGGIVRLPDGRVLWKDLVDAGLLYDPASRAWATAGGPTYPADPSWGLPYTSTDEGAGYYADTLTLLPDGRVLMTTLGASLLYDPNGGQ